LVILAAVCDGVYCGSVDVDNVLAVVDKSVYFQGVGCKHTSLERVTKVNAPRAFRGVRVAFDARVCGSVALVRVILGVDLIILLERLLPLPDGFGLALERSQLDGPPIERPV
jgi:hypothetical protein